MARKIFLSVKDSSGTAVHDPSFERAHSLKKASQYPGGLYGAATFTIPREINDRPLLLQAGHEIHIGLYTDDLWAIDDAYHGYVYSLEEIKAGSKIETKVRCVGAWGWIMETNGIERNWADTRVSEDAWQVDKTVAGYARSRLDRQDRLRVTPREEEWKNGYVFKAEYQTPTDETIGKVTCDYELAEEGYRPPAAAKHNNAPGGANTFTDLTNAIDGDTDTEVTVTITSDDYVYVGVRKLVCLDLIRFEFGTTKNAATATMSAEYWQGATDAAAAQWASLSITDGTNGSNTWDQDGNITFTPPDDWERTTVDSESMYWVRFQPSANLTANIDIKEIEIGDDNQAWELELHNGLVNEFSITASGTGSQDVDLGTNIATLRFQSAARQTPAGDGSIFGELSDLTVFASRDHASGTLGTVDVYEIALDIVDLLADAGKLSTDVSDLDSSLTFSLVPFITNGFEHYGPILARAAAFGDSSLNSIGFYLLPPFLSPDRLPRLVLETFPDLSDYDYEVSADEVDLSFRLNLDDVYNYIIVSYKNLRGEIIRITPGDDATLEDTDSQADYGLRVKQLHMPLGGQTAAINNGKRFLTRHKDPTYAVTRPIRATEVRAKSGMTVPAAAVDAGQRLRIVDIPNLSGQGNVTGTTLIITRTDYDHDAGIVSMSVGGAPDRLDVLLAQRQFNAAALGR